MGALTKIHGTRKGAFEDQGLGQSRKGFGSYFALARWFTVVSLNFTL